ncbi:MAG: cytochrome c-type biogenesis protein CcmH [Burkholderiaceae bacterium]|nr:cytochrome c-type biogenesis protein CcmH [Burkholderiaceae bacterium]
MVFCFVTLAGLSNAAEQDAIDKSSNDLVLEKRVHKLTEELRCLVCQNQTIADSHAGLAIDLKNQVREKVVQGASDQEILDYMVQRYGDFVLYRPPVKQTTWLLWFGPFLLMLLGLLFLTMKIMKRPKQDANVSEAEMLRAAQLLRPDDKRG